jgi:hypothetical protein
MLPRPLYGVLAVPCCGFDLASGFDAHVSILICVVELRHRPTAAMDGDGFNTNREWEEATQEPAIPNPAGNMV